MQEHEVLKKVEELFMEIRATVKEIREEERRSHIEREHMTREFVGELKKVRMILENIEAILKEAMDKLNRLPPF